MRHTRQDDKQILAAIINGAFALILIHLWRENQQMPYALASVYCSATCILYAIQIIRRYL
jgi:hypothetical protein